MFESLPSIMSFANFRRLLLILTGLAALMFLVRAARWLPVTQDNMYPEAAVVVSAQRWAQGLPLYTDYRIAPYLITTFPPPWYYCLAGAYRIGLSTLDSMTLFGRILSLTSLFAVAILAYLWNRRRGFPISLAILSPTFLLSFPVLIPWAVTARPDFPALLFSLLAVLLVGEEAGVSWTFLAGLLAGLSFLFRHSSIAAPVAIGLWLLVSRQWKAVAALCSGWFLAVVPLLWHFEITSHGLLRQNLSGSNFGTLSLQNAHHVLMLIFLGDWHQFAAALFALGFFGFLQCVRRQTRSYQLISIYFTTSLGLGFIGSMLAGASTNYYFETAIIASILVVPGLMKLQETWPKGSPVASFMVLVFIVWLVPSLDYERWLIFGEKRPDYRGVLPLIAHRPILTDIAYLGARSTYPEFLDPVSLTLAERAGHWSSEPLVKAVRNKQFEMILLFEPNGPYEGLRSRWPHTSDSLERAISASYDLCAHLDEASTYAYGPLRDQSTGPRSADCSSLSVRSVPSH